MHSCTDIYKFHFHPFVGLGMFQLHEEKSRKNQCFSKYSFGQHICIVQENLWIIRERDCFIGKHFKSTLKNAFLQTILVGHILLPSIHFLVFRKNWVKLRHVNTLLTCYILWYILLCIINIYNDIIRTGNKHINYPIKLNMDIIKLRSTGTSQQTLDN